MKAVKYGTDELGRNSKEERYMTINYKKVCHAWFDKKHNYKPNSTTVGRHIGATSGWTNYLWMKNMEKTYVILEEVLTIYYDKLREIGIYTKEMDAPRCESFRPPLR